MNTLKYVLVFSGLFMIVGGFVLTLFELVLAGKKNRTMKHDDSIELSKLKVRVKAYAGVVMMVLGVALEIVAFVR